MNNEFKEIFDSVKAEESLKNILKQYGFGDIEIEKRKGAKHRIDEVVWLSAYARKG